MPCCLSYSLILLQQLTTESGASLPYAGKFYTGAEVGDADITKRRRGLVVSAAGNAVAGFSLPHLRHRFICGGGLLRLGSLVMLAAHRRLVVRVRLQRDFCNWPDPLSFSKVGPQRRADLTGSVPGKAVAIWRDFRNLCIASTFRVRAQVGRPRVSRVVCACSAARCSVRDQVIDQVTPCGLPALQCYPPFPGSAQAPHKTREQDRGRQDQGWHRRCHRNAGR